MVEQRVSVGDWGFDGHVRDVEVERQNVSDAEGVVEELLRDTVLWNSSNSDVLVPFKNSVHSARYCAPSCMVGINLNFKLTKDKTSF